MSELNHNNPATDEKESIKNIFEKWVNDGGAERVSFEENFWIIERASDLELPDGIADDIANIMIIESDIPVSWFELFNRMPKLEGLSLRSCELPGKAKLPDQITHFEIKRIKTRQAAQLLKKANTSNMILRSLIIDEFNFDSDILSIIRKMESLESLTLISTNPSDGLGVKPNLKSIHISQITLFSGFENWISNLKNLESITITNTRIKKIKPELLSKVKYLILDSCEITELPECSSTELKHLEISNIAVKKLHENYLPDGLEVLNLSRSQIKKLPDKISTIKELKEINFKDLNIEELPDKMACSQKLKRLDLSFTQIKKLPDWLSEIPDLEFIGLSGCSLDTLSGDVIRNLVGRFGTKIYDSNLGDWKDKKQEGMYVKGLLTKTMDPRYLRLPNADKVLEYFFGHARKKAHEIKLFVMGETTKLRKAVVQNLLDEPDAMEDYLDVSGMLFYEITANNLGGRGSERLDQDTRVHVYEIDEGDAFQLAHQMFYSDVSLYLVVLRSSLGNRLLERARHWAKMIELKAPNSSICFCIMDEDMPVSFNKELFKNNIHASIPIEIYNINNEIEDEQVHSGIKRLKTELLQKIKEMPAYTWEIPIAWRNIKNHVTTLLKGTDVISMQQFKSICEYYHGDIPSETLSFLFAPILTWLGETGAVFLPSQGRKETHEVLPDNLYDFGWYSSATYGVLRYAKQSKGIVTSEEIWRLADEADDQAFADSRFLLRSPYILNELIRAGICIKVNANYLFPCFRDISCLPSFLRWGLEDTIDNRKKTEKWLASASTPSSMNRLHYIVSCPVITEALLSALFLKIFIKYRKWIEDYCEYNHDVYPLIGRDAVLLEFPPQKNFQDNDNNDVVSQSGSLLVSGITGGASEIHIYASGSKSEFIEESLRWEQAHDTYLILEYASIALEALEEVFKEQLAAQEAAGKFVLYVEIEGGPNEKALVPLIDIKQFYMMKRTDYYCAPLNKTLDVGRIYKTYHLDSLKVST